MIRSFGDRRTQRLFEDQVVQAFQGFARRAKRKLESLHAAARLEDLTVPPSNRLEKLRGDLGGHYSIRINDQWAGRLPLGVRPRTRCPDRRLSLTETAMPDTEFAPVTPGEILKEEFLAEYGLSQNQLARAIEISPNRIADIVKDRRRITADTALRLSLYFGNSAEFWLNLQAHYDLKIARQSLSPETQAQIKRERAA